MTDRELMQQALKALDRVMRHGSAVQEAKDILLAALSDGTEQPQRTHWEGCDEVHPECKKPEQEQGDSNFQDADGCPTEMAVLQRFWRGEPIPAEHYPVWFKPAQQQEPVAWLVQYSNKHEFVWGQKPQWIADAIGIEPLYTAPQRREWVGLTDEEKAELDAEYGDDTLAHLDAIEAKLKEKNNG